MGTYKYGGWAGNQWGGFRVVNYEETTSKGNSNASTHWMRYLEVWGAVEGYISTTWAGRIWVDHRGGGHQNYAIQEGWATIDYNSGDVWSRTKADIQTYTLGYWVSDLGGWVYYPDKPSYTVTYNSNGGSGSPATQTKVWGSTLTLSSVKPSRSLYDFLGWSESSTATTATYQPGAKYTPNKSTTLYAVWKLAYIAPTLSNCSVNRIGDGTDASATFSYSANNTIKSDNVITSAQIRIREVNSSSWLTIASWTPNSRTGTLTTTAFKSKMGEVDTDCRYLVEFIIKDSFNYTSSTQSQTLRIPATTATENLLVKMIKDTDFASPAKINDALVIFDKLGLDYVVEEHMPTGTESPTTRNWWWRIWNSGRVECGIDRYFPGNLKLSTTQLSTNLYQTETIDFGNYPSSVYFEVQPFVTISFQYDNTMTGSSRNCWTSIAGNGTTERPPSFSIVDYSSNEISPYVSLYAVGRSK